MNPLAIYQTALNSVSEAVLACDFDAYAAMIDLPYLVHTDAADLLVTTRDALRPTFDALSQGLKSRGITHYERVARSADYVDRDRIEGQHFTHMIADGERIACPTPARQAIVRRGNRWLFSEAHYAIAARRWPVDEAILFAHVPLRQAAQ
jgi:hypothetical protein